MSPFPALFLAMFGAPLSPVIEMPNLSARLGVQARVPTSGPGLAGPTAGFDVHLIPSVRAGVHYGYAQGVEAATSSHHGVHFRIQGRLDWVNLVPWIGLGPAVIWTVGEAEAGVTGQVGVDLLRSPNFSWGLYVEQDLVFGAALEYAPGIGLFGAWTWDNSSPF